MQRRLTVRYWILQIHCWLGLLSGLVVLIVSITGCLFVFQKEIAELLHKERYFISPAVASPARSASSCEVPPTPLSLSLLQQKAQHVLGAGRPITTILTRRQPDRTWEFMAYQDNDTAFSYFGAIGYYQSVFLDPYTGAVTGNQDHKYDFFSIVKYIHWSLLLNTAYGQPIVGWSTLIFVILLITGLVLWWPKKWNPSARNRSFKIKWTASFKRVNYDLHNVSGFYSLFPALIISLTGLVFAFKWFTALVYLLCCGTTTAPARSFARSQPPDTAAITHATIHGPGNTLTDAGIGSALLPLDKAFLLARQSLPAAERIALSPATGKEGVIYIFGYEGRETYYGYDALQFDQYTGRLLQWRRDKEKKAGERLVEMNYDIHVGAIGGLAGKIIAFIASLICASLPVTGFLIWWGKKRKGRMPSSNKIAP